MNGAGAARTSASRRETQMLGTTSVASYGPSFMIDDLTYHYEESTITRRC